MAVVKPLVEKAGEVETLQAGDSLDVGADTFQKQFTQITVPGQPLYSDSGTTVNLAQGNASSTSGVVGLSKEGVAAAANGPVVHDGVLALTTIQWDAAITGGSGGLVVDTKYYLDNANPGKLLSQGNLGGIGVGEYVLLLGRALSSTELLISKHQRILR